MTDISILKEMIKPSAIVPLVENIGEINKLILKEPDPANYSVTFYGMPEKDQVIIINPDAFKTPETVFVGSKGECKRADFIIIANTVRKKVILCVEMKAGKGESEQKIIQQLHGAKCVVTYCQEIGKLFWNCPDFLTNYECIFLSIKDIKIQKTKTRPPIVSKDFRSNSKIIKRTGSSFQFNDLIH
jgi:hypothetical protein